MGAKKQVNIYVDQEVHSAVHKLAQSSPFSIGGLYEAFARYFVNEIKEVAEENKVAVLMANLFGRESMVKEVRQDLEQLAKEIDRPKPKLRLEKTKKEAVTRTDKLYRYLTETSDKKEFWKNWYSIFGASAQISAVSPFEDGDSAENVYIITFRGRITSTNSSGVYLDDPSVKGGKKSWVPGPYFSTVITSSPMLDGVIYGGKVCKANYIENFDEKALAGQAEGAFDIMFYDAPEGTEDEALSNCWGYEKENLRQLDSDFARLMDHEYLVESNELLEALHLQYLDATRSDLPSRYDERSEQSSELGCDLSEFVRLTFRDHYEAIRHLMSKGTVNCIAAVMEVEFD